MSILPEFYRAKDITRYQSPLSNRSLPSITFDCLTRNKFTIIALSRYLKFKQFAKRLSKFNKFYDPFRQLLQSALTITSLL